VRDFHHALPFPILTKARTIGDPLAVLVPLKYDKHFVANFAEVHLDLNNLVFIFYTYRRHHPCKAPGLYPAALPTQCACPSPWPQLNPDPFSLREKELRVFWRGIDSGSVYHHSVDDPSYQRHLLVKRWGLHPHPAIDVAFGGGSAL
jgi:hypothetical protein